MSIERVLRIIVWLISLVMTKKFLRKSLLLKTDAWVLYSIIV